MAAGDKTVVKFGGDNGVTLTIIQDDHGKIRITPEKHARAADVLTVLEDHLKKDFGEEDVWQGKRQLVVEIPESKPVTVQTVAGKCEALSVCYSSLEEIKEKAAQIRRNLSLEIEVDVEKVTRLLDSLLGTGRADPEDAAHEKKIHEGRKKKAEPFIDAAIQYLKDAYLKDAKIPLSEDQIREIREVMAEIKPTPISRSEFSRDLTDEGFAAVIARNEGTSYWEALMQHCRDSGITLSIEQTRELNTLLAQTVPNK